MMLDICVLVLAVCLLTLAANPKSRITVGKFHNATASGTFKVVFLLPLALTLTIVASARLFGDFNPKQCPACSRVQYSLAVTPYVGWALTVIGLMGLRSFRAIHSRGTRGLVIVSIIAGPFLMGIGFHDIVQQIRA
jgi:hypothetical protein